MTITQIIGLCMMGIPIVGIAVIAAFLLSRDALRGDPDAQGVLGAITVSVWMITGLFLLVGGK